MFGRGYLRNVAGLFFGLIFPVILILIFGAIFSSNNTGKVTVYLQNQDTSVSPPFVDISANFTEALNSTSILNVQLVDASENFTKYLSDHSSSDGIIIPANFSVNYALEQPVNLTVYGNPTQTTNGIILGVVNGVNDFFNLKRYGGSHIIGLETATVGYESPKYIDFLIPGLIGFSILVSPMFSMVNIASEYKKSKLFRQLSLTPITKFEWLLSKIIFYIVLAVISFLLMTAVGIFLFDAHITLTVWLIPFFILGPMLFCSLGMLVGIATKSVETASVLGNIITFPMMFLSGTFFPISIMPEYLRSLAHVLPLFYVVEGLNNVMVYGNYTAALVDITVIAAVAIVIFVAAAKLFKWRED
ncbi:MAG TPA: ABC transporter permease [Candidatus Bathyarchaeia archaeon]|nr:ABC transporter permease [Candidatus Bathyarchaeia archaeon]